MVLIVHYQKKKDYVLVDDVGTTDFTMPGDAGGGTKGPDVDAYWDEGEWDTW